MSEANGTALATVQPMNDLDWWKMAKDQASMLIQTGFLPQAIDSVPKAVAVMMKGRELGVPPMYALGNIHIINQKPSLSAELMLALVQRDYGADRMWVASTSNTECRVEWIQHGTVRSYTFTIQDAQNAKITGNAMWVKYPAAMLRARAISAACRMAFPASIAGMYTPEELGGTVEVDGDGQVIVSATPEKVARSEPVNIRRKKGAPETEAPETEAPETEAPEPAEATTPDVQDAEFRDIADVGTVDTSTGEIVDQPEPAAPTLTSNYDPGQWIAVDTESEKSQEWERLKRQMYAGAKNKLSDEQLHVVIRAWFGVRSIKELNERAMKVMANTARDIHFDQVNTFIELCDCLIDDPSREDVEPLTLEDLPNIATEIGKQGYHEDSAIRAGFRFGYKRAELELRTQAERVA
jgi:hypothetical protein